MGLGRGAANAFWGGWGEEPRPPVLNRLWSMRLRRAGGFGSKFWALGGDLGFGLPGPGKAPEV